MLQPTDIISVKLSPQELLRAAHLGINRQVYAIFHSKVETPSVCGFNADILAACGELSLAKALNIYWNGELMGFVSPGVAVRTTDQDGGALVLTTEDSDVTAYVLVVGKNAEFKVVGWVWGKDAKNDQFKVDGKFVLNMKANKEAYKLFRPVSVLLDYVKTCTK